MRRDDLGPYSIEALAGAARPALFVVDQKVLVARYVAAFEAASGRKLYPMQVEMLLIETLAYAMGVLGEEAQAAAEQHLVAFADDDGLERLGPNRSTPRLPAAKARVTLSFGLQQPQGSATFIPAGTRVGAGLTTFRTLNPCVIRAGAVAAETIAEAETAGVAGNGFLAGQITDMLDPIAGVSVSNITESAGGADIEATDLYRLRLANAFERISTGGSFAWYRETAMGVSPAIIDVAIIRPQPCYVDIYPLTPTGPASIDLRQQLAAVFDTAAALDIRFGDKVTIRPPVAFLAAPTVKVRGRAMGPDIVADATIRASEVLEAWREQLGAILAPSEIEVAIKGLPGVIDVEVSGLPFRKLDKHQYLDATFLTVTIEDVS